MNSAARISLGCVLLLFGLCACGEDLGESSKDMDYLRIVPPIAGHVAFWTGSEMLVYGGGMHSGETGTQVIPFISYGHNGLLYDPATDGWKPTSDGGPLYATGASVAVWTGANMITYGYGKASPADSALSFCGSSYDPAADAWTPISTANAPTVTITPTITASATAVWTGSEMVVRVSDLSSAPTGTLYYGHYNPGSDTWSTSAIAVSSDRSGFSTIWTGKEMIIFGGYSGLPNYLNIGRRYDPVTMTSTVTSTINAPSARSNHVAVWTGSEMIVFGGDIQTTLLFDGARYDPNTDTWTAIAAHPENTTISPGFGYYRWSAIWSGTEMIVWYGGYGGFGGRYNPTTDTWTVPSRGQNVNFRDRAGHSAIWTGQEMIIWGGTSSGDTGAGTGARYDPQKDTWTATSFIVD